MLFRSGLNYFVKQFIVTRHPIAWYPPTAVDEALDATIGPSSWDRIAPRVCHCQGYPLENVHPQPVKPEADQARKLQETADRSGGKFTLIRTSAELSAYLDRRIKEPQITAGFLGIEGAHALDGNLDNLDRLFDAGVRMMAPTHFFDNDIGGSAHGVAKGGLSDKGREMIRRMEAKKMIVDLAHASPQTIDDVLSIATRPVVVSHTGVKGTCDNTRNLSDDQLKAIAKTGGVIGIGFWDTAVCGNDARAIARAIRYTANLVGVDHVALGSDNDGAVTVPFDISGVIEITDALLQEGFTDEEVGKIMGRNTLRLLVENLP